MQKLLLPILFVFTVFQSYAQVVSVPDTNFSNYLLNHNAINTNGDAFIQVSEANAYTGSISCGNLNISDLTGIEAFINIYSLTCHDSQLDSVNLTQNTALTRLNLDGNNLTSIDVSNNTALTSLNVSDNQLNTIDISNNTALTDFYCTHNQFSTLNLNANTALEELWCHYNQLTSLDVSSNTALTDISCYRNSQLATLDLSNNVALELLWCHNTSLGATLDVSHNTNLRSLHCYQLGITSLDVSNNTALQDLYCHQNALTQLDVRLNTALIRLRCHSNQLTSLNMQNGNNSNMVTFSANSNPNLNCIQVDDTAYANSNWMADKDSSATFSTDCSTFSFTTNIQDKLPNINVYPNPTNQQIRIELNQQYEIVDIKVLNSLGSTIKEGHFSNQSFLNLDLDIPNGLYWLQIQTEQGQSIHQILKK